MGTDAGEGLFAKSPSPDPSPKTPNICEYRLSGRFYKCGHEFPEAAANEMPRIAPCEGRSSWVANGIAPSGHARMNTVTDLTVGYGAGIDPVGAGFTPARRNFHDYALRKKQSVNTVAQHAGKTRHTLG